MRRAQIKRVILQALKRWRPITDTDRWEIEIFWGDTPETADGMPMGMVIEQPEYEAANLYVNLELIAAGEQTVRSIEYDVLHELCHCHLAMLVVLAEKRRAADEVARATETATKKMASAIWRARTGEEPPTRWPLTT